MSDIINRAQNAQSQASDPNTSAWVAAHAGSGKTTVLSRRVMRLLLSGANAGSILCLTFTRSAAANMANKVYDNLSAWVKLSDEELSIALEKTHQKPSRSALEKARRLFAESLETPGGLKVQTIHAFCGRILRQFPLEAGISADFTELDEETSQQLFEKAKAAVFAEARYKPDIRQALIHLSQLKSDYSVQSLLSECLQQRKTLKTWLNKTGSMEAIFTDLQQTLGVNKSRKELESDCDTHLITDYKPLIETLESFIIKHSGAEYNTYLGLTAAFAGEFNWQEYMGVFLTQKETIRKTILTKPFYKQFPQWEVLLNEEAERVFNLNIAFHQLNAFENTRSLLILAMAIVKKYEFYKTQSTMLDFDDLVDKTANLLSKKGAEWVLYKLDAEIDHILVDEAQDTSPSQWQIIENLVSVFLGGEAARQAKRSLFVVGDEKQSIFSFQGADPQKFDEMRQFFNVAFHDSDLEFHAIPLQTSFRSSPTILSFVDKISQLEQVKQGLIPENATLNPHEAARDSLPGLIELWSLEPLDKKPDHDWRQPIDKQLSNIERLAQKIAKQVQHWLSKRENITVFEGGEYINRAIKASDILILVKNRKALFDAVLKAMKSLQLPVAGADRLNLIAHIAIEDLLNLGESLLCLEDDLKLANLLKSPFFDMSEEALFMLAHHRPASLWQSVQNNQPNIAQKLLEWRELATSLSPAAFYHQLLTRYHMRKTIVARFGREVEELIDAFLSEAENDVEKGNLPLLLPFIMAMKQKTRDIKRDLELTRDEVRVMTVHGAKGLEANIVILADATLGAGGGSRKALFNLENRLIWSQGGLTDNEAVKAEKERLKQKELQEYQRLLYVALTRAASRLLICGLEKTKEQDNWYKAIYEVMEQEAAEIVPHPCGEGKIMRWFETTPLVSYSEVEECVTQPITLPDYLIDMGENNKSTKNIRKIYDITPQQTRGTLTHKLLQYLPAIEAHKRHEIATAFLTDKAVESKAEIVNSVLKLLEDEALQPFFQTNSQAEVKISGLLRGQMVERQIDRLSLINNEVWFLDYKSTPHVPKNVDNINFDILAQMSEYYQLLRPLFPNKTISCKVIFTHNMSCFDVPAVMLTQN